MTLKGRNRYTFTFSMFFLALSLFFLAYFVIRIYFMPTSPTTNVISLNGYSPFSQNIMTIIFSELCLLLYIPLSAFYIYQHFLKTPATEVIYFMIFLLGCSVELFNIFIPLEILQDTVPETLVAIGRAVFWGRTLCVASLFVSAVAGDPDQRVNAEQNIFMIIVFSLIIAATVPINTIQIAQTLSVKTSFNFFMLFFYALTAALTFSIYAVKAWQNESRSYLMIGIDLILIEAGLFLLNSSGILIVVIPGVLALNVGTFRYLARLHRQYV